MFGTLVAVADENCADSVWQGYDPFASSVVKSRPRLRRSWGQVRQEFRTSRRARLVQVALADRA